MTPANVIPIERGRLRRAVATGDPARVLDAVEVVLDSDWMTVLFEECTRAFYDTFWLAVEDEALADRAGTLDVRLGCCS